MTREEALAEAEGFAKLAKDTASDPEYRQTFALTSIAFSLVAQNMPTFVEGSDPSKAIKPLVR